MPESERLLEKIFERGHALLENLSDRWDLNVNRRTVIILLLAGALATFLYIDVIQPPANFPLNELVAVSGGQSLAEIADTLEQGNVVRSSFALRTVIKLMGNERRVHAGDYIFKEPQDIFSIAHTLAIGAYGLEPTRVRVNEGATTYEMATLFKERFERFDAENFLAQTKLQEGYLFPDTYFFLPNVTEDTVIQAMRQNFDSKIAELAPQIASSTHSLSDIVIMASLIEREAHNSVDRRKISGVLWNRLERNMLLQVDVAFLYTIGKGTYQLTVKDLASDSPYNTYKNKGLPPTAIGSPSLDSLRAAVDPIESDNLFYLADRSGVTYFSKTYAEHLRKKNLYIGNY